MLPQFKKVQQRAAGANCLSNLRQIGAAVHSYLGESNMMLPVQGGGSSLSNPEESFLGSIAPYVGWDKPLKADANAARNTVMHCPSHTENPAAFSYRISIFLIASPTAGGASANTGLGTSALNYLMIKSPSKKVLAWDLHATTQWPLTSRYDSGVGKAPYFPLFDKSCFAHSAGNSYLFADGHAEIRRDAMTSYEWWRFDQ